MVCYKCGNAPGQVGVNSINSIMYDKTYRMISAELRELMKKYPDGRQYRRVKISLCNQLNERIHMWEVMPRAR